MSDLKIINLVKNFQGMDRPAVNNVNLEWEGFSVSATQRLSILKPIAVKSPETRAKTPGSLSTKIDIIWRNSYLL